MSKGTKRQTHTSGQASLSPPPPERSGSSASAGDGAVKVLIGIFGAAFISLGVGKWWDEGSWRGSIPPIVIGVLLVIAGIFWSSIAARLSVRTSQKAKALASEPKTWWISLIVLFVSTASFLVYERYPPEPATPFSYVDQYGPLPGTNPAGVEVIANGAAINKFAPAQVAAHYLLGVAAFHWEASTAIEDADFEMKSSLREITNGPIDIGIAWSDKFQEDMRAGKTGTQYVAFLVPQGTKETQYSSLSDVRRLGGYFLEGHGGPP